MDRRSDEELCTLAEAHARRFLRNFDDPVTRQECDDLVQESAVTAWQWSGHVREPGRFGAAVRTIARRKRYRALKEHYLRRGEAVEPVEEPNEGEETCFVVGDRRVPGDWLMPRLRRALSRLATRDRCILLAYHEGFCCAEIAERFDLREGTVKVRMHRARHRVRIEIERAVVAAGAADVL